ncbi:hypothetical protein [Azospirillum agricola]|uniref:hypothetical protein n=1 Tax=Azospirillum agricola TaxID=1720247 RepID=UPI000A0EF375|nr:hypothetical protein [Azospirillum agricola]SMH36961.1 hypothetical protein SAMN02982994_1115 [Azospirillum lipoferum]
MTAKRPPQPTRFAIQKARGKGWKTLEVGEDLDHAKARFAIMVGVNPRAYFRLIQLDYNADSGYEGMEFNWTLIELYDPTRTDPTRKAASKPSSRASRRASSASGRPVRRKESVALPFRVYLAVVLVGALVGGLVYLHFAGPGR